jgi:hypothetical protein
MAGCGRLAAGVRNPGQPPQRQRRNVQGWPPQVPPPSNPAARWPCRADTDRIARRPAGTVTVGVSAHRSTRPAAGHHGGRASAPTQPLQMAVVRHVCRTPAVRSGRTGRCPPADRPADMAVEAAAEGPQGFRPGGGTGTGCRTPDRSGSHPPWTPRPPAGRPGRTQDRTPEAADGQSAGWSLPLNYRSLRLVTTSSTLPQGRPCGRPPTAAVLGRQHLDGS